MPENITFRTQLLGGVTDFCLGTALPILGKTLNLVELIVLLARYKEEGVKLCPTVYLTNDIEKLSALLPGGERVKIGTAPADSTGIKNALKKCAPLSIGGWNVYVQNLDREVEYGLFRDSLNPVSVLIDDVLMAPDDELRVVKAYQVADECVEVIANNGTRHYIFLDHRKEDSPPPLRYLDKLVSTIMENAKDTVKEPAVSFLKRQLFESLRQSHGCLIAVTNMHKAPKFLSDDGVILESPIDFSELVENLKKDRISSACLESKGFLLGGMLSSDGIVLFDTRGQLLGYNCFVKNRKSDGAIGGARRRAFAPLKEKIGKGLRAAFIQSQDGWSDFAGGSE